MKELLCVPGASSCLLDAAVPYSKNACVDYLSRHGQDAEGVGFCSEAMARRLALAARDRGLELEELLARDG